MRKRFISICMIGILLCGICGCARTAEDDSVAKTNGTESKNTDAEDIETVMSVGGYGPNEEEIVSSESVNDYSETDGLRPIIYATYESWELYIQDLFEDYPLWIRDIKVLREWQEWLWN